MSYLNKESYILSLKMIDDLGLSASSILDNDVILELEMIETNIILIGGESSLSAYAEKFGSLYYDYRVN